MDKIKIIGISGKMGVGKDKLAKEIMDYSNGCGVRCIILSFADALKMHCIHTREHNGGFENIVSFDDVFVNKTNLSREILQSVGESMKIKYGEDLWVNYLIDTMKMHQQRGVQAFVITDVRFKYEAEALNYLTFGYNTRLIRIDGYQYTQTGDARHISETDLDDYDKFDYVLNNNLFHNKSYLDNDEKLYSIVDNCIHDY